MKTTKGHITATEKKHIKAIMEANLMSGKINNKTYFITKKQDGNYEVKISQKDRGLILCDGSELRMSTYTHEFQI